MADILVSLLPAFKLALLPLFKVKYSFNFLTHEQS